MVIYPIDEPVHPLGYLFRRHKINALSYRRVQVVGPGFPMAGVDLCLLICVGFNQDYLVEVFDKRF